MENNGFVRCILSMRFFLIFLYFIQLLAWQAIADENKMFSSRIQQKGGELLVVKNDRAFIRKISNNIFEYENPKDGCYTLDNNVNCCIENGIIKTLSGDFVNVANEDKIAVNRTADEFFGEKNVICNAMKFDIIKKLMVDKEEITGFGAQLYLLDYYSVIRLFLYRDDAKNALENENVIDDDNPLNIKAFIVSDRNDVGCPPFNNYRIYQLEEEEHQNGNKKKKKKKKIVAKTQTEFLKKLSEESYKPMLLNNYIYLQPISEMDNLSKMVLYLENNVVKYINVVAMDFEWKRIGFYDVIAEKEILKQEKQNKKKKVQSKKVVNKKKTGNFRAA